MVWITTYNTYVIPEVGICDPSRPLLSANPPSGNSSKHGNCTVTRLARTHHFITPQIGIKINRSFPLWCGHALLSPRVYGDARLDKHQIINYDPFVIRFSGWLLGRPDKLHTDSGRRALVRCFLCQNVVGDGEAEMDSRSCDCVCTWSLPER